jgi:hypothetical protein
LYRHSLLAALLLGSLFIPVPASGQVTGVSAASYQPLVAPNSLASLFGDGLATTTATAHLDA